MKLWRLARTLRRTLHANRFRVALSLSGTALGIASVIVAVAVGEGARLAMLSQMQSMGSNVITVSAGSFREIFGRKLQTSVVTTLKRNDAHAVEEGCAGIVAVVPAQQQMASAKFKGASTNTQVVGCTPDYLTVRNLRVLSGRCFTAEEERGALRVAVIGQKVRSALLRNSDPLGKMILVRGVPFRVIGVLRQKGMSYDGANEDDVIIIPLKAALDRVMNINYIGFIYIRASGEERMSAAESQVRNLLRERHRLNAPGKRDDFSIQNSYTSMKVGAETNASFERLVSAIASISLLVGGVGILAVMLLSVKERGAEIGLRMAVGARTRDILVQFLLEAGVLGLAGGIAGILLGVAAVGLLNLFGSLGASIPIWSVALSVFISMATGMLFGSWPAMAASRVQPARSLQG